MEITELKNKIFKTHWLDSTSSRVGDRWQESVKVREDQQTSPADRGDTGWTRTTRGARGTEAPTHPTGAPARDTDSGAQSPSVHDVRKLLNSGERQMPTDQKAE